MRIKVKDIYDNVGGFGEGVSIIFELRAASDDVAGEVLQTVRRESWHTPNSSNTDYYIHDEGDRQIVAPWDAEKHDPEGLLDRFLDEVVSEYWSAYREFVNPALERAVDKAIAASEAMGEEPEYDGITVDML